MPAQRNTLVKIVAGHVDKTTVDNADAIKAWAHVTDQPYGFPWVAPNTFTSSVPSRTMVRFIDGSSTTAICPTSEAAAFAVEQG